jgi:hypothetical protein
LRDVQARRRFDSRPARGGEALEASEGSTPPPEPSCETREVTDIQELERRMRPGAWSHEGFLGSDERLEDVILADRQTLEELELEPGQLADTLDCLLGAFSARTLIELADADAGELDSVEEGREDMEKAVQEAAVSVTEAEQRFGPVEPCQLPLTLLFGTTALELDPGAADYYATKLSTGVLIDRRFEVLMISTFGYQECPWSPTELLGGGKPCAAGSSDWGIRDRQRGLEMKGPELITHLIREHGFFEGFESPYRVDPRALAKLLQVGPFAEPT